MFCAPSCSQPNSWPLNLLTCEQPTQSSLKCRRFSPHWHSEERRWCLHNGQVLRQLAIMLHRPVHLVCSYLYQLTLQKFGQLLNPKGSHWNYCRVPFVRPDTCALYDGIFDLQGNLRNPLHPFIRLMLVGLLRRSMNSICEADDSTLKKKKSRSALEDQIFGKAGTGQDILTADDMNMDMDMDMDMNQACGLNDFLDNSTFGDKSGAEGRNGKGKQGDKDGNSDKDGKDGKRGKRGRNGYDDYDDDDSDSESDSRGKNKKSINDISDLYNSVVEDTNSRQLIGKKPRKKPPTKSKKRKYKGLENRRYMGLILPVLMHEPFDSSKPWTWIRRHPGQERIIQGTNIGRTKIHRYMHSTLAAQYQRAKNKDRLSVRSHYSVASVASNDMFGRTRRYTKKHHKLLKAVDYKEIAHVEQVRHSSMHKVPKPKEKRLK